MRRWDVFSVSVCGVFDLLAWNILVGAGRVLQSLRRREGVWKSRFLVRRLRGREVRYEYRNEQRLQAVPCGKFQFARIRNVPRALFAGYVRRAWRHKMFRLFGWNVVRRRSHRMPALFRGNVQFGQSRRVQVLSKRYVIKHRSSRVSFLSARLYCS